MNEFIFILKSCIILYSIRLQARNTDRGRRGRDRMVVGFTTTFATGAYHH